MRGWPRNGAFLAAFFPTGSSCPLLCPVRENAPLVSLATTVAGVGGPYLEFARLAPVIPCAARNPYEREPREISLNGLYLLSLLLLLLLLLHFPSAQIPPFLRFSPLLRNLISRRKLISCELCEFSCEFRPSDAGDICLLFVESIKVSFRIQIFCLCNMIVLVANIY